MKKREKPVVGSWVAKNLLWFLRDERKRESESVHNLKHSHMEEIEFWEETIRETVKSRCREPRDVLELDGETVAALDELFLHGRHHSHKAELIEFRRRFALRMIKTGCEAVARNEENHTRAFYNDFAVEFRDMTDAELEAERMARQVEATC